MIQFAEVFPTLEIVSTLSRQLGWSHFVEIIPLKEPLQRDFYAEMCRIERWSVRTLREKINGRWLEKHEQQAGEEYPIGLILCAGKSTEQVELLQLEKSGIRVAEYLTGLPPREILEKKLHEAIQHARQKLENKGAE
jgi:hypothetical protein